MGTFSRFKKELRNAINVLSLERRRDLRSGIMCPLGIRTWDARPSAKAAAPEWGIKECNAAEFMEGFDGGTPLSTRGQKYFRLGKKYRRKCLITA